MPRFYTAEAIRARKRFIAHFCPLPRLMRGDDDGEKKANSMVRLNRWSDGPIPSMPFAALPSC
jgi:hypothetical protein